MIKFIRILLIIFTVAYPLVAQSVQVVDKTELTSISGQEFYFPVFSNGGKYLLLTKDGYNGLWLYNFDTKFVQKISDENGAGFQPVFSSNDDEIFYRTSNFNNFKRISTLKKYSLLTGSTAVLIEDSEELYAPVKSSSKAVFSYNGEAVNNMQQTDLSKVLAEEYVVEIENSNLVLFSNSGKKTLNPLGSGNYLWPSISPDGKSILFTKAGQGTYVCDLNGNILYDLGKANYPVWAKDGKWVVFMTDIDDGVNVTSSDIEIVNVGTLQRFNLTDTDGVIEMYPDYSLDTDEVVYHTLDGKVLKLKLKFN